MKKENKKTVPSIIAIIITSIGILASAEYVVKTNSEINNNQISQNITNNTTIVNTDHNEENNITNNSTKTNTDNNKESNITNQANQENTVGINENSSNNSIEKIPEYSGKIVIGINGNTPYFNENEITTDEFEIYSELDNLNRAQIAFANISKLTMPPKDTKRGNLSYKPSGWIQYLYGENNNKHLYERCHLIAWQLGNENNNKKNLITGTTQLNNAMIEYENAVADWIKQKNKENKNYHVLYRVTPIYNGENKLATGVEIEAKSVEEEGICFNKFIYNVHNEFEINYSTGQAKLKE